MKLEEFVPYIAADVPECPPFIIERAAMDAIIEFCSKSWALNELLDPESVNVSENFITFSSSNNKPVCGILEVSFNGEPLDFYSSMEMDQMSTSWKTSSGQPEKAIKDGLNSIILCPKPNKRYVNALQARIAFTPRRTDSVIDDMFSTIHFKAICDGATALLLLQQHKNWFNPNIAAPFRQNFETSMYSARNVVMRNIYQRRPPVPKL